MDKRDLLAAIENDSECLAEVALEIWSNPEVALNEYHACDIQKKYLSQKGFIIHEIPNNPTCFIAEYGSGKPIIGVTGEYDALPNQSQKVCTHKIPERSGEDPGHGCGHNLLGAGSMGAAVAIKQLMESEGLTGTIRYYGCAAEEILSGKTLMAKEHVFDDLDACISWHPAFLNTVMGMSFLALNSIKFRFKGIPAHAAAAPEAGRSALDAVELMNVGSNYLREHVIDSVRIHYAITNGGGVPNTVPEDAEVWYYIRAPRRQDVCETTDRIIKIAEGAALMTETKMSYELVAGCYDVIPNHVLSELLFENLQVAGTPNFDADDFDFAKKISEEITPANKRSSLNTYFSPEEVSDLILCDKVTRNQDYGKCLSGSSDVGDISYIVPFAQISTACWPVGCAAHTWQACACAGSPLGVKGMIFAAKALAYTLYDLFTNPAVISRAKEEFETVMRGRKYISPFEKQNK